MLVIAKHFEIIPRCKKTNVGMNSLGVVCGLKIKAWGVGGSVCAGRPQFSHEKFIHSSEVHKK